MIWSILGTPAGGRSPWYFTRKETEPGSSAATVAAAMESISSAPVQPSAWQKFLTQLENSTSSRYTQANAVYLFCSLSGD